MMMMINIYCYYIQLIQIERLHEVLPVQDADGWHEVVGRPEEPPVHVGASAHLGRVESLPRRLVCEVLHDGVRLPEEEAIVVEEDETEVPE